MADGINIVSVAMAIASAISALLSYYMYRLTMRVNILRPHSDRLREKEIVPWLREDRFLPEIVDIADLPLEPPNIIGIEYSSLPELKIHPIPRFTCQHLRTGYPKLFNDWKRLMQDIINYHHDVQIFVKELMEKAKSRLKLPCRKEAPGEKHAHYYCLVKLILSNLLRGIPPEDTLREEKPQGSAYLHLWWSGRRIMIGDRSDCTACRKLIKDFLTDPEIKRKAEELNNRACILRERRHEIRQALEIELIEKIVLGGVIKGRCDICDA
ncbi:MAG: hypothetical protein DRJ62_06025 [Thermoprotei archaeon]|nr:MAG: hypothetical protein DRJ62_06025 [Thermoprotei archaeon]